MMSRWSCPGAVAEALASGPDRGPVGVRTGRRPSPHQDLARPPDGAPQPHLSLNEEGAWATAADPLPEADLQIHLDRVRARLPELTGRGPRG